MSDHDIPPEDRERELEWRKWMRPHMQEWTNDLWSSPVRRWAELRERLHDAGVPDGAAAVARLHPDDVVIVFGVVAARDGRAFLFEFRYPASLHGQALPERGDEAWVSRWEELSDEGLRSYERELDVARSLLAGVEPPDHPGA